MNEGVMEKGLISVIVPVYQAINELEKCVYSILNQSYKKLQIILVDDCSTDGSAELCDNFAQKDMRVLVYHFAENQGSVLARKKGLELATGEYIGFADADDYLLPEMFNELFLALKDSGADFVHSWYISEYGIDRRLEIKPYNDYFEVNKEEDRIELFEKLFLNIETRITPSLWSKLYKSEFVKNNFNKLPHTQCFGEDYVFLFYSLENCKRIKIIDSCNYIYSIKEESLSHKNNYELLEQRLTLLNTIKDINKKMGYPITIEKMHYWLRNELEMTLQYTDNYQRDIGSIQYYLPNVDEYRNKKIILYGAGNVGRNYLNQLMESKLGKPVAIVDKKIKQLWDSIDVIVPNKIVEYDFDVIIIAVLRETIASDIKKELISIGISEEKIIWEKPIR